MGDKGYSSGQYARRHGIRRTIPCKANEGHTGPFYRAIYRQRDHIERLVSRRKQFRRLAAYYQNCADNYQAI
jgi:hypothetical protein